MRPQPALPDLGALGLPFPLRSLLCLPAQRSAGTQCSLPAPLVPSSIAPHACPCRHDPHNWLKLRAFGLTQYDAVLLVEPGAMLTGDIAPLFALPTDFAAGWDQVRPLARLDKTAWGFPIEKLDRSR